MKTQYEYKERFLGVSALAFLVLLAWLINGYYAYNLFDSGKMSEFGDAFGVSNSLFSGFALAGLIYAVLMQRKEVRIAREDLRTTKNIMDAQQIHMEAQNSATIKTSFEATFFNMLSVFSQIKNRVYFRNFKGEIILGETAIIGLLEELESYLDVQPRAVNSFSNDYTRFHDKNKSSTGNYFRTLYNVIKFVDNSNYQMEQKKFYTNIIRAQLSDNEALFLFYNGISPYGEMKFKPLIERYALLKNVSVSRKHVSLLRAEYSNYAFGTAFLQRTSISTEAHKD